MGSGDYTIIRSRRRTVSVEVTADETILVRAPKRMPLYEIDRFVADHDEWIKKHLAKVRSRNERASSGDPMTREELEMIARQAAAVIPQRVRYYAAVLGVTYNNITIRNQKTLWGSCSAKGNLSFNCLLMKVPERVRDYVIVHELCHRIHMNHSPEFWKCIENIMPDYKKSRAYLAGEGAQILFERMRHV